MSSGPLPSALWYSTEKSRARWYNESRNPGHQKQKGEEQYSMETEPVPLNLKYQLASMSGIVRAQVTPRSAGEGDEGAGGGQASGITDLKGMLLTKVQVQLIFWGTNWGQASPSTGEVTKAVQNILSGPYMLGLSQYRGIGTGTDAAILRKPQHVGPGEDILHRLQSRSEEHTSELQSHRDIVCRLLLENKKYTRA